MAGGQVDFDEDTHAQLSKGFLSNSATDAQTLSLIKEIYNEEQYMLDPHGAVALQALMNCEVSWVMSHCCVWPLRIRPSFRK